MKLISSKLPIEVEAGLEGGADWRLLEPLKLTMALPPYIKGSCLLRVPAESEN